LIERHADLRRAILLSAITVVWDGVAGGSAIILALSSGSLSLLGFGFDTAIDSLASIALIWRFAVERDQPHRADRVEQVAAVVVGAVLLVLGVFLGFQAIQAIAGEAEPGTSAAAIALLVASAIVLPPLGIAKRRLAERLASGALRGDSVLTLAAGGLAVVGLVSALLATLGLRWADAVAALLVAVVLVREGWGGLQALRAEGAGPEPG
jgi:divalent metal cation (Fe/Co/Zn/Cd) transporter